MMGKIIHSVIQNVSFMAGYISGNLYQRTVNAFDHKEIIPDVTVAKLKVMQDDLRQKVPSILSKGEMIIAELSASYLNGFWADRDAFFWAFEGSGIALLCRHNEGRYYIVLPMNYNDKREMAHKLHEKYMEVIDIIEHSETCQGYTSDFGDRYEDCLIYIVSAILAIAEKQEISGGFITEVEIPMWALTDSVFDKTNGVSIMDCDL